jgi:hypothetical protein
VHREVLNPSGVERCDGTCDAGVPPTHVPPTGGCVRRGYSRPCAPSSENEQNSGQEEVCRDMSYAKGLVVVALVLVGKAHVHVS